jgi:hypothetical protein
VQTHFFDGSLAESFQRSKPLAGPPQASSSNAKTLGVSAKLKKFALAVACSQANSPKPQSTIEVNNVPFKHIPTAVQVFQDEGISAILWRDN